jgi:hypothetical protein
MSGVTPLQDFPIAPRDRVWDSESAEAAVRVLTGSEERPNAAYAACFFWHDAAAPELFGSYRLPYCDVIDAELTAVPHAIFSVAGILDGARGGTTIPKADQERIKAVVAQWYERMTVEFDDPAIVVPWASR